MKPSSPSREGKLLALSGIGAGFSALALLAVTPACVGMHGQGGLDALSNATDGKPIVEAFFEYPGPQDRWAGPSTLVVHVTARENADPTITVSPGVFQPEAGAADFSSPMSAKRTGLTTSIVRDRLALVATALSANAPREEAVSGCLSPVRARLIRSDGSLLEKRGCRNQQGWAFQAADAATDLITMAENGPPKNPAKLTSTDVKAAETKAATTPAPAGAAATNARVSVGAVIGAVVGGVTKDRKPADAHKVSEAAKSPESTKQAEAAKPAPEAKSHETTKPATEHKAVEQPKAAEPVKHVDTPKSAAKHEPVVEKNH